MNFRMQDNSSRHGAHYSFLKIKTKKVSDGKEKGGLTSPTCGKKPSSYQEKCLFQTLMGGGGGLFQKKRKPPVWFACTTKAV